MILILQLLIFNYSETQQRWTNFVLYLYAYFFGSVQHLSAIALSAMQVSFPTHSLACPLSLESVNLVALLKLGSVKVP